VAFTPDGAALLSASHDQTVKRTNVETGKLEWQTPGYFEQVNSVALSPDGTQLVTGSGDHRFARGRIMAEAANGEAGAVRLWDLPSGRMLRRLGGSSEQIMAVAISTDGGLIAAGGAATDGRGVARVWDAPTGALRWSMNDHAKEVLAVAFSQDGKSIATASADGIFEVRDSRSGQTIRKFAERKGGTTAVAFSPDGKILYCGEAAGSARAWEIATGRLVHTCQTAGSKAEFFTVDRQMNSIGLTRDGATLATCGSSVNNEYVDSVKLWDTRTGQLKRDFAAEKIHGRPMAFSADGSILATGGKSVRLWDVATGKLLREFTGHLKRTQSIVFSSDGRFVIAGGSYGTTNIWEVATGRHLVTLFAFNKTDSGKPDDDWFAYAPEGYYVGSPNAERYLAWRRGDELLTPTTLAARFHQPDRIEAALKLDVSRPNSP
jgi:WD40 repeat protein